VTDYEWSNDLSNYLEICISSTNFYFLCFCQYTQVVIGHLAYTCGHKWCRVHTSSKGWFLEDLFNGGLEKVASEMA
jgi:hypothetical protein